MKHYLRYGAFFSLLALGGCMSTASAPHASNVDQHDLAFITTAYQLVHFDLNACSFVQKNELEPTVRPAIDKICADAAKYEPKLRSVAEQGGVKLPNTLPFDLKAKLVSLTYHPEPSLTVEFLRDEIASHESAVAVFKSEIREGTNPQFKAAATEGLPLLQQNLDMLRKALPNGMAQ